MKTVKLGDVCGILSGFAFKSSGFGEKGTPIIRIRDVVRGFTETFYDGEFDSDFIIENGDILIGMDGDFNLAKWNGGQALLNQRVCKLEVDENKYSKEFLYYFLPTKLLKIWNDTPFVTVKHLSVKKIIDIDIPDLLLSTQKQIAAILEKADQLCKDCQQMEQELNNLAQAVFIDMFGESASGYDSWDLRTLESLADTTKGSMRTGPFGSDLKHSEFVDNGIAVIGIDNAVKNEFSWGERRFITPEKYEKLKRYRVYPKDIIITIMGTTGRIAVIPDDIPLAISTKHLAVITLDESLALPEFIHSAFIRHPFLLAQLRKKCKGAIMDGLNLGLIKSLEIHLPPIERQQEYVDFLSKLTSNILSTRLQLEQFDACFNSLMLKAFSGELNLNHKAA